MSTLFFFFFNNEKTFVNVQNKTKQKLLNQLNSKRWIIVVNENLKLLFLFNCYYHFYTKISTQVERLKYARQMLSTHRTCNQQSKKSRRNKKPKNICNLFRHNFLLHHQKQNRFFGIKKKL